LDELVGRPELADAVARARRCGEQVAANEKAKREDWEAFLASLKPKVNFRRRIGQRAFFKKPDPLQDNPRQEEVVSAQDYIPEDVADDATLVPEREARAEESKQSNALVVVPQAPPKPPVADGFASALAWMNQHHAIIDNVGGKCVIAGRETCEYNPEREVWVFQAKESFLLRYSNQVIQWQGPGHKIAIVPLGQWWLQHPERAQYRGVVFLPGRDKVINDCLNLWTGWGIEPVQGDWSLIRQHIEVVIANGNKEFAEYVVRWIAWAIQHPAEAAEVALVLIGEKGAGKGTLVRCLELIFGLHTFQVTSRDEVIGKFNGHLQDCILFVADEAYWGGDKRCVGRLQGMITEPKLPIERKGIDLIRVPNCLHILMLAEPGWVIPAGRYERRYAAFAVSEARLGDKAYFKALHKQMNDGGAAAMFWDLQRMDLGDWHPREIPKALLRNAALQKQQGLTLPPMEQWYVMLLHEAQLPHGMKKRPNTALTVFLMEDAKERVPRLKYELSEVGLRNFLTDPEKTGIICTKYRAPRANGWSFPPLAECRTAWEKRYGPTQWDVDVEEWKGGEVW